MGIPTFASRSICVLAVVASALSTAWLGVEPAAAAHHRHARAARVHRAHSAACSRTSSRHHSSARRARRSHRRLCAEVHALRASHTSGKGVGRPAPKPVTSEETTTTPTETPPPTEPTPTPTETTPTEPIPTPLGTGWDGFGGLLLPGASWRPYSASSPFNRTAEGAVPVSGSQAYVEKALSWGSPANALVGTSGTTSDWSHPTYYAQPSDPIYTLHATESWGKNVLEGMKIPVPEAARPAGGGDGHMAIVTPDGWEYDLWRAQTPPAGGGTLSFAWGGRTKIDGSGLGSGGTAANFGNAAGMIRAPEMIAGHIDHALFIVLKCAAKGTGFGYGTTATSYGSSYVYPAMHGGSTCASTDSAPVPLGTHFVLGMSDAQIQGLAVPTWKKTILTALAQYGGYVGDTGGPGFALMFESGSTYTALGLADPIVAFAIANGLPKYNGGYVFNVGTGVEWGKYLRVVAPPSP